MLTYIFASLKARLAVHEASWCGCFRYQSDRGHPHMSTHSSALLLLLLLLPGLEVKEMEWKKTCDGEKILFSFALPLCSISPLPLQQKGHHLSFVKKATFGIPPWLPVGLRPNLSWRRVCMPVVEHICCTQEVPVSVTSIFGLSWERLLFEILVSHC